MKKVLMVIIVVAFVFGLSGMSFAEKVTKIVGNKITVVDDAGKVKTIESSLQGLKVGDKVTVMKKNGLTWLNPQPEPPKPVLEEKSGPSTPEQPTPPPKKGLGQVK